MNRRIVHAGEGYERRGWKRMKSGRGGGIGLSGWPFSGLKRRLLRNRSRKGERVRSRWEEGGELDGPVMGTSVKTLASLWA